MKKNTDTKQMLFEMMAKIDPTFKPSLNEEMNISTKDGKSIKVDIPNSREIFINGEPIEQILEVVGDDEAIGNFPSGKINFETYFNYITGRPGGVSEETFNNNRLFRVNIEYLVKAYDEYQAEEGLYEGNEKSSYSDDMVNDIKVLLGNRPTLSPNEIQQLATDYQVGPEEVQSTLDYVISTKQGEQQPIPSNSQEAEEVNDFFNFLKNNPQAESIASLWYVSTLNSGLAKPKQNPMVNRFLKLTKYMFEWERTYAKEIEKVNPEWQIQQRKGDYSQVEGFNIVKRDSKGDEVIDIIPRNPKSIVLILDESGNVADTLKSGELQGKYAQYFTPSFLAPSKPSGSGVDFRSLKLYATKRIAAGGKEWINPKFKYEKYSEYFNQIPKGEE